MRFAGKAFFGGMFGAFGVAVAVLGTGAVLARIGEHVIRKTIRDQMAEFGKDAEK